MNPKTFLLYGGALLLVLTVLGLVGVLGPTPERSLLGENLWFDGPQNWIHLLLGVLALVGAFALSADMRRNLTLLFAVIAFLFALYGLFTDGLLFGANLETPLDDILHLVLAVWAFLSWRGKESS